MESALYGIHALVVFVSEILLVRCAQSFDFWYVNNSCVNTVRQHFPWSILYTQTAARIRRFWRLNIDKINKKLKNKHNKFFIVLERNSNSRPQLMNCKSKNRLAVWVILEIILTVY